VKVIVLSFAVPLAEVDICKGKNKGCHCAYHKAYRRNGVISPFVLSFSSRWDKCSVSHLGWL